MSALGLSGVGALGFLGLYRGVFLPLGGLFVALSFYLNVVRRRSRAGLISFLLGASVVLAAAVYALLA